MKITTSTLYQNRVLASAGFKFDKARIENNRLLFDEDEIKTVKFNYEDRVVTWTSSFDLSFLTESDVNDLLSPYLVPESKENS